MEPSSLPRECAVVIVGGGNAAMCAALSAAEAGAQVLLLERAPEAESGGNSRFTAGAMKCVYEGVDDPIKARDLTLVLEPQKADIRLACRGRGPASGGRVPGPRPGR